MERASIQPVVDQVVRELGGIDILLNNAGIIRRAALLEFTEKDWDDVIRSDGTRQHTAGGRSGGARTRRHRYPAQQRRYHSPRRLAGVHREGLGRRDPIGWNAPAYSRWSIRWCANSAASISCSTTPVSFAAPPCWSSPRRIGTT